MTHRRNGRYLYRSKISLSWSESLCIAKWKGVSCREKTAIGMVMVKPFHERTLRPIAHRELKTLCVTRSKVHQNENRKLLVSRSVAWGNHWQTESICHTIGASTHSPIFGTKAVVEGNDMGRKNGAYYPCRKKEIKAGSGKARHNDPLRNRIPSSDRVLRIALNRRWKEKQYRCRNLQFDRNPGGDFLKEHFLALVPGGSVGNHNSPRNGTHERQAKKLSLGSKKSEQTLVPGQQDFYGNSSSMALSVHISLWVKQFHGLPKMRNDTQPQQFPGRGEAGTPQALAFVSFWIGTWQSTWKSYEIDRFILC